MAYGADLTQDEQRAQEVEIANERARGHVEEIARLVEQGAPSHAFLPYLDQLRADLNTVRTTHPGWAGYQAPQQGVSTTPTGLAGTPAGAAHVEGSQPFSERDAELEDAGVTRDGEVIGSDGLTDSERAAGVDPNEEHRTESAL